MQIRDDRSLDPAKSEEIIAWIRKVEEAAQADFSRDPELKSRQNNHLYWAAWGVASAAMATNDRPMFDWAVDRARFGISQIQADGSLPLEVARGQRAFLYHLFAAMPLFMLAEAAYKNGQNLFTENDNALRRLGDLNIKGVIDPGVFKQLTGKDQVLTHVPSPSDLGWLEIYAQHYSDPRAGGILEKYRPMKASRMGGDISLLYARINGKDSGGDDGEDNASPNN